MIQPPPQPHTKRSPATAVARARLGAHCAATALPQKQEAEILWKLRHPHIVEFAGLSISKGKGYLLMELMEGGSLHSLLDRDRELKQQEASWHNR